MAFSSPSKTDSGEIPSGLYATIKRTEKPEKGSGNFIRFVNSSPTMFPGIRFGDKAFESFYSHAFLANTSEKRASFEDNDDDATVDLDIESLKTQDGAEGAPKDAWEEEESLLSGVLSSENAAKDEIAESLYNNGNVLQEVKHFKQTD